MARIVAEKSESCLSQVIHSAGVRRSGEAHLPEEASEIRFSVHVYWSDAACLPTTPFVARDGHLPGKVTFIDRIKEVKRQAVFFANQGVVS